ncbi:hypothetical protein ACHAXT_010155 [Thalassiosira profunda]
MVSDEFIGFIAAFLAALSFGSYGVPMKGETATKLDIDPFVFQSYKAFAVFAVSAIIICINNALAEDFHGTFQQWTLQEDFTWWAFVSAFLWVPGGTAGVYAIRRAGLAISVGIWSCVIVLLSYVWGVWIFGEKQKSAVGAFGSVAVLCLGLVGIAYYSSIEVEIKKKGQSTAQQPDCIAQETTPLVERGRTDSVPAKEPLDFEMFPHCGTHPHCHQVVDVHLPEALPDTATNDHTLHITKYKIGLGMAVVNGVLAALILVPMHYAPAHATRGIAYSMSFGIAAVTVVAFFWILRFLFLSLQVLMRHSMWSDENRGRIGALQMLTLAKDSMAQGYRELPSFHLSQMWGPGLLSGILYSSGNLFGIISIQRLGNFMGYSLNQASLIVSGLFGLLYYREVPGLWNIVGFFASICVCFSGILLMAEEHV